MYCKNAVGCLSKSILQHSKRYCGILNQPYTGCKYGSAISLKYTQSACMLTYNNSDNTMEGRERMQNEVDCVWCNIFASVGRDGMAVSNERPYTLYFPSVTLLAIASFDHVVYHLQTIEHACSIHNTFDLLCKYFLLCANTCTLYQSSLQRACRHGFPSMLHCICTVLWTWKKPS